VSRLSTRRASLNLITRKRRSEKNLMINKRNETLRMLIKHRTLMIMLVPAIIYYIIFHYFPMYGVVIAFKDFNFSKGIIGSEWIGLVHFKELFELRSFWEVFNNTIVISFYRIVFGFPAPIIFALLLSEIGRKHFKKLVQTISYLPHFISWVILGGIFLQLLSPSTGPLNYILKSIGVKPIFFLGDPKWFRLTLVSTGIWKAFGWGSVIYIASLAAVNPELYEASIIDGANRFKRVIHVSLPAIVPVISIMLIFAVGGLVNDDFDQIFNMYNAAVYRVGDVLSTYLYRVGLEKMQYERATAIGLFKNVIAFSLIIMANSVTKRINDYGVW
jgi:putative aldouronate transport system permease protein